ncbi:glycosyltransferase family 4 protein [Planctomicrobium sp. SH661]|uniref:glycosyltransferase family 4 protein n=1 Tax=Planctomicrobium sp. SH661 TaxID=3448124 RepID=UPI003F5BCFA0
MRLVQICNVGNICGGTAACAWSITRALRQYEHVVLFLGRPTPETIERFAPVEVSQIRQVDDVQLDRFRPDLVILHNTSASHAGKIRSCLTLQYLHSACFPAEADRTVACSRWLASRYTTQFPVLRQPVPYPPLLEEHHAAETRHFDDVLTIGRLCTPRRQKWPTACVPFYSELADRFPQVNWEFVGCPADMQGALMKACHGKARFFPAGWDARRHLRQWHALLYHHPTLTESFGRTVAEAMRAECIPIVDHRGGFCEQIVAGETGFLCESIEQFAAAIESLQDPARRWSMALAARRQAEERFSFRAFETTFRRLLIEWTRTG